MHPTFEQQQSPDGAGVIAASDAMFGDDARDGGVARVRVDRSARIEELIETVSQLTSEPVAERDIESLLRALKDFGRHAIGDRFAKHPLPHAVAQLEARGQR